MTIHLKRLYDIQGCEDPKFLSNYIIQDEIIEEELSQKISLKPNPSKKSEKQIDLL